MQCLSKVLKSESTEPILSLLYPSLHARLCSQLFCLPAYWQKWNENHELCSFSLCSMIKIFVFSTFFRINSSDKCDHERLKHLSHTEKGFLLFRQWQHFAPCSAPLLHSVLIFSFPRLKTWRCGCFFSLSLRPCPTVNPTVLCYYSAHWASILRLHCTAKGELWSVLQAGVVRKQYNLQFKPRAWREALTKLD